MLTSLRRPLMAQVKGKFLKRLGLYLIGCKYYEDFFCANTADDYEALEALRDFFEPGMEKREISDFLIAQEGRGFLSPPPKMAPS